MLDFDDGSDNMVGAVYGKSILEGSNPKPESENIVCQKECHFAVLSRKEYNKVIAHANKKEFEDQAAFLSSLSIFQGFQSHVLKQWIHLFDKKEIYSRKQVVYRQGDQARRIYVLRSGKVVCNKMIPIQTEPKEEHHVGLDESNHVFLMDKELVNKKADLVVLGPGQVFGDEEALEAYINFKVNEETRVRTEKKKSKAKQVVREVELGNLEDMNVQRKMTITVDSAKAEIWSIPFGVSISF